ncbi:MAG: heme exporter protein CcmB [Chitinophagales bacterium]|nr:heme exporter protein CcmB [Chitinophagales bacterium]
MFREISLLIKKDLLLEWRMRYAIGGIVLYVVATVFVIYIILSSEKATELVSYRWWSVLFWITMLFTAVNAIAKSFTQENKERLLYYYTLVRPQSVILSKMLYNMLLMLLLSVIGMVVFSLMLGTPVKNYPLFLLALLFGGSGLSFVLTLVSSIAAKADGNATLMAILSLPVMLPLIMVLQQFAGNAFFINIQLADVLKEVAALAAFDVLLVAMSCILFPYLWRD